MGNEREWMMWRLGSERDAIQEVYVCGNSLFDFLYEDELIGGMRAFGLAGIDFERRKCISNVS